MILRTDTIRHIENPIENDIVRAFFPTKANKRPNDIIKLQIDEGNYLCVWLGYNQNDNTSIYCKDYKQKRCSSKFECEKLIKLFIQYLNGRVDWISKYKWEKTPIQKFIEAALKLIGPNLENF